MRIPEDKNTRAETMWQAISQNVDFSNKCVIDLGCGYADILRKIRLSDSHDTSLTKLYGIDLDIKQGTGAPGWFTLVHGDISAMIKDTNIENSLFSALFAGCNRQTRIAMCFSVLPYLDDIPATIQWMADNFDLSLIEVQYDPEPFNVGVVSDRGMAQLLLNNGFNDVKPIGKSYVDYRDQWRTIWKCKK